MLFKIISFISFIGFALSTKSKFQFNIDKPYIYNGFIYTDSHVVIVNPSIQIKIVNNEEICNFYINDTDKIDRRSSPFRAIVKSAYLGLGELVLKSNVSLVQWRNTKITFSIVAEACHDPDSWSEPATVSIKVLDPPGPLWLKSRYYASINKSTPIGTLIVKVTAYLPKVSESENRICEYLIKSPEKSPFQIDGEGTIRLTKSLQLASDERYWTLTVVAKDCSLPEHRQSQVNVFLSINPLCKLGWTGFYTLLKYRPGSGIKYLCKNPRFHVCESGELGSLTEPLVGATIQQCIDNKSLRLTTSVELKSSRSPSSTDAELSDQSNCKLDSQSLKLQREVCGVSDSYTRDLLSELNKEATGPLLFPMQSNIFPVTSLLIDNKFSFYFWIKKDRMKDDAEEYIVCQIDEIGNNIFSVSLRKCILRVRLKSYDSKTHLDVEEQNIPTSWAFSIPQLCDDKWHHVAILASRASHNPYFAELSVFFDGEMTDYRSDNPEVQYNAPTPPISSNMTDVFLAQCPKSENTEFKGLLAGVSITPGVIIKSSTPRCLTKCSERLYFNGMNQMNPGMSVSLNSEMQMIIINGHSIEEVTRLVKVIGFVNPTWNPRPGDRHLKIETEISCGNKTFQVSTIRTLVRIDRQKSPITYQDTVTLIKLFSTVTTILIPDSFQTNPTTGTGVAVFNNTTLDIVDVLQSTRARSNHVSSMISKCIVSIHPKLQPRDYLDWPRHLIKAVSGDKYSIEVTNDSRTLLLQGLHNQQIYQFIIQHLRYFSPTTDESPNQSIRTFKLQCFSTAGKLSVKSNVAVVKVTIWYNKYLNNDETLTSQSSSEYDSVYKGFIKNKTAMKSVQSVHAHAALISEMEEIPRKANTGVFNILLVIGLLMLATVVVMIIRKTHKQGYHAGHLLPHKIIRSLCFPLHLIKDRIVPGPSVRVELSRDFINGTAVRRRDISMEMQWDDAELKANTEYNIIANPMFETSVFDIDDIAINRDVPPACEEEEEEEKSNDDVSCSYEDFTDLYFDRNRYTDKGKRK